MYTDSYELDMISAKKCATYELNLEKIHSVFHSLLCSSTCTHLFVFLQYYWLGKIEKCQVYL